jgi:hypothetical protein
MRNVLVYRSEVLAISETFIAAQMSALENFHGSLIGLWPAKQGLTLSVAPALLCKQRTKLCLARSALFRLFGFAPGFYVLALI